MKSIMLTGLLKNYKNGFRCQDEQEKLLFPYNGNGVNDDYDPENPFGLDHGDQPAVKGIRVMADHSELERHCKEVCWYDNSNPGKSLAWLRAIDTVPVEVHLPIACLIAHDRFLWSLRQYTRLRQKV